MALNFPLNPSDGDTYQGYVYDATDGVWNANQGQIVSRFSTNATQPDSPSAGDGWFNPANGKTYIYYDGAWVESGSPTIAYPSINNISDVDLNSPASGEALVYDGTSWGNQNVDVYDVDTTSTGYFSLPKGTEEQRPSSPSNGDIRFNTDSGEPEWYSEQESQWVAFRSTPSFTLDYLVVAGGAGGGSGNTSTNGGGGGGGAGGLRSSYNNEGSGGGSSSEIAITALPATAYSVVIGAGGGAQAITGNSGNKMGYAGSNSVFGNITSTGGGAGGGASSSGGSGGSGGGAGGYTGSGGTGTLSQGYSGGNTGSGQGGSGGGGASAIGGSSSSGTGASGGAGLSSTITGSSATYAGGGGGGGDWAGAAGGSGGSGGGGAGGRGAVDVDAPSPPSAMYGTAGSANSGGGGGAGGSGGGDTYPGGGASGGSGVVIIRYPSSKTIEVGAGLTYSTSTVGDDKVTIFTAGADTVIFS